MDAINGSFLGFVVIGLLIYWLFQSRSQSKPQPEGLGASPSPGITLSLQLTSLGLSASVEGIAIGIRQADPEAVAKALQQIVSGDVARGPALAKLVVNQIEEKYDWALTAELRSVGYASRHFDERGASDAAKEILASSPRTDQQP
jgi:hypothetical protein